MLFTLCYRFVQLYLSITIHSFATRYRPSPANCIKFRLIHNTASTMANPDVLTSNCETFNKVSRLQESVHELNSSSEDEPQDSGRRRSLRRKPGTQPDPPEEKQVKDETDVPKSGEKSDESKGRKRKKNVPGDGSGSESDGDGNKRSRAKVDNPIQPSNEPICTCPKNVMRCIGILPSLPIVSQFYDSDDSRSSEEYNLPVLPSLPRNPSSSHSTHE